MGTNFYKCRPRKTDRGSIEKVEKFYKQTLKDIITKGIVSDEIISDFQYELEKFKPEKIHLGKRSGGWQFLWNHNNKKYYQDNLESIKEFLNDGDGWIEDEYGEIFTPEQLLNDEIGDCLYNDPKKYINGYQYDKRENCHYTWQKCGQYEYTTSEGLRFSTSTEFS